MNTREKPVRQQTPGSQAAALPIEDIQRAVESIRYGTVQLIIQDGRIIQIDKTEKIRLA